MNEVVYRAAREHGCSRREAEVIATYVESASAKATAKTLDISAHTVHVHLLSVRRRLNVKHTSAAVARLQA